MKGTFEVLFSTTVFVVAILIGLYFDFTRPIAIGMLLIVGAFVAFFVILNTSSAQSQQQQRQHDSGRRNALSAVRSKARSEAKRIVKRHMESLARRRITLVRVDHYGTIDKSAWYREIQHFADKVILPELTIEEAESLGGEGKFASIIQELIDDSVRLRSEEIEESLTFSESMPPQEFEKWCANELGKQGWKCITTQTTGDQGADVVAEKKIGKAKPIRIVIQCKLWGSSVGNKAVQEAHAAKAHYIATHAAVVSNAKFTISAKQLAKSTNVFLWHFSDLERVDKLLKGPKA